MEKIITKKIDEQVKVIIDVRNMQPSSYVGMRVYYPGILKPVIEEGGGIESELGVAFEGRDVDAIANDLCLDDGKKFAYVSLVLKSGDPISIEQGRVITLWFTAIGHGTGEIVISTIKHGRIQNQQPVDHPSTSEPMSLTLVDEVPVPVAHFTIEVE